MAMAFDQKSEIMASGIWEIYTVFYIRRRQGESFSVFFPHHDGVFLLVVNDKEAPLMIAHILGITYLPASGVFPVVTATCPV